MKEILRSQAVTGSITPLLEGAARSDPHAERAPAQTNIKPEKGGTNHE